MKPNDDLFGCFGNTCSDIILAISWPCLLYGEEVYIHNVNLEKGNKPTTLLGFWSACLCYVCCISSPCVPGTYLRILRGENPLEGCLSYCACPCCALLQDLRRVKSESVKDFTN